MCVLSSLLCALVASPPEACKALRGFYDAIGAKDKSPSFTDRSSTCCAFLDVRCTQPDGSPSPPLGQKEGWKAGAILTKIKFRGGTEFGSSGTLPGALLLPLAGTLESLDLGKSSAHRSFSGTLPAELAQLTALQKLSLTTGKFSGTIPHQLGRLPALEKVTLLSKRLSGTVPGELCHRSDGSLRKLVLDDNVKLSGTLPPECFLLPTLEEISAKKTRISGTMPSRARCQGGVNSCSVMSPPPPPPVEDAYDPADSVASFDSWSLPQELVLFFVLAAVSAALTWWVEFGYDDDGEGSGFGSRVVGAINSTAAAARAARIQGRARTEPAVRTAIRQRVA
ncbi:hypothetical protein EMIHUDRAFT_453780 [Emiliania huxleyi CCMP1516]|uniref:Leucine-rich repeat-containing N-terminal plant-type domain-containing protein n=2 Tax=Emiliania huxleyi TaxID=2903 RepID=A0A0D3I0V1_EMIH1|nr:hypothetical protein EMIHUDRAFT_453780 [Emiliania huxleyi CCMP1516]EOD04886.1 hypothetical protein EMIHUDRAFT_453780 [Emiliania huxleyi CCMP1516]|eukprot:XP_005757315.1 hypothetical protein EMIHUDRAFT_453780 [Emiliania huxleyi CCMP1516]